ncbi:MAG: SCO family protein [Gemmatimonadaceae bacterium]|nr:SCO family protein [Gemmatimonadaceae bacterium]
MMPRRPALALSALAMIIMVTVAWWTLALWPAGDAAPDWVTLTREVCFGAAPDGLPGVAGWLVLIGEPIAMFGFLLVVWGGAVREGLGILRRSPVGRGILVLASLVVVAGAGTASARVAAAWPTILPAELSSALLPVPERLQRAAPTLDLVDQRGDRVRLAQYRGRPVVVAFGYGHCETVCPLVVRDAVRAVERVRDADPVLMVVTLDPWRDTPARLPHLAAQWALPQSAHLLGGSVEAVESTLDAWGIWRQRDERTGEIVHPSSVYLFDREGRLAWIASGGAEQIAALVERL